MGCGSSKTLQASIPIDINLTTSVHTGLQNAEIEEKEKPSRIVASPRRHSDVAENLFLTRQKRIFDSQENESEALITRGWLSDGIHQLTSSSSDFKLESEKKTLRNATEYLAYFDIEETKNELSQSIQDVYTPPQIAAKDDSSKNEESANTAETGNGMDRHDFTSLWAYLCEATSNQARCLAAIQHGAPLSIIWRHSSPNNANLIQFWINIASVIEEFDMSENFIGPEGFRAMLIALSYLPNLKSVKISSNKTDRSCSPSVKKFLSNSPILERLDVSCNDLSGGSFGRELAQGLQQASHLVSLNLSGCGLVDIEPLMEIDSHCEFVMTIRQLDLSHNPINSELFSISIRNFMSKVRLEELNLNACELSSYAMSSLVFSLLDSSTLLKLNTNANKFSGKSGLIQLVTACMLHECLCELSACNVIYSQEIRESQNQLANLIKERIEEENASSRLRKLALANCDIDTPFLKLLRANMITTKVELTQLDLSNNSRCTANEIRLFAWGENSEQNILGRLESLIGGSYIGDDIIGLMKDYTFPLLKSISLIRSKISPNRVGNLSEYICKVITSDSQDGSSNAMQLTDLVLDGNKLSGTNRSAIVNLFNAITFLQDSSVKVNWSLTSLSLNSCSLNDSDIKPITKALSHGLSLVALSLAHNRLGDNALVDLAEGLNCCKTLRTIDLANNSLGSKGATVLADCLSRHQVERILVSGNLIGGDGVLALINLTRICSGITLLDLRNQKAGLSDQYLELVHSSVKAIIESRTSVGNNKALVVIKLSGVGEQYGSLWHSIDSPYIETNSRQQKSSTVGMWEALTLLYSFKLASTPRYKRYIREYERRYQHMSEGVGEVGLSSEEWKETIGSSTHVPSWLLVECHRERGVFVCGLSVAVTQDRLAGILEAEANCQVVEVVMCKDPAGRPNGSAWVLFTDRNSVVNAIEYYNHGLACLYGEPFVISPLAVRVLGDSNAEHLELVRADIGQRAAEQVGERREHTELIEQKYVESQERHGKLLANPAYPDGRIW